VAIVDSGETAEFRRRVFDWYELHRRALPWRDVTDPYAVLVSEVMLQQTGVDRVILIYKEFLERFPTFGALADAPRREVLRAWAGLGYNRRAVHLHECAQVIVREHEGHLPDDAAMLRRLPGIGPYTTAAILSFAFHRDVPTVDTNIRRVLGRITFGHPVGDRELAAVATRLVPAGRSSDWNQALMDFGSLQCVSVNPRCLICPLLDLCATVAQTDDTSAPPARRIAERAEQYLGSRRFYRGRIVACLRDLPAGASISPEELLRTVKPDATPAELPWIEELGRVLVAEGLAEVHEDGRQARFRAPA